MEPSERSKRVLSALIREYIASGEPVASSLLVRAAGLGVSSATVRNVLARLEMDGFVQQPHTSAGRVPTDRGYRFYVDLLLEHRRPGGHSPIVDSIRQAAIDGSTLEELLAGASRVLSQESHHVGFALSAVTEDQRLRKIEFVALGGSRVLVVTIAEDGQITQKVVDGGESLTSDDLRRAAE